MSILYYEVPYYFSTAESMPYLKIISRGFSSVLPLSYFSKNGSLWVFWRFQHCQGLEGRCKRSGTTERVSPSPDYYKGVSKGQLEDRGTDYKTSTGVCFVKPHLQTEIRGPVGHFQPLFKIFWQGKGPTLEWNPMWTHLDKLQRCLQIFHKGKSDWRWQRR
jgi:hypothetical protein